MNQDCAPKINNKLLAPMRQAILQVRMLLYKDLRDKIRDGETAATSVDVEHKLLCAALINNLFGTPPEDPGVTEFARQYPERVEAELRSLAIHCPDLLPLLTDALRMQAICDYQEGSNSIPSLLIAQTLGILQMERPLPLPSAFMTAVRARAVQQGLIQPMDKNAAAASK